MMGYAEEIKKMLIEKYGKYFGIVEGSGLDATYYPAMMFLKHKNYVYLSKDGRIKMKGSKLISRSIPKIIKDAINSILEVYLKGGDAEKELSSWIKKIYTSDNDEDFYFSLEFDDEDEYTSDLYASLAKKFGSGIITLYVCKDAPKRPKPFDNYASYEEFEWERLDRDWYAWYLTDYILKQTLCIYIGSKKTRLDQFIHE